MAETAGGGNMDGNELVRLLEAKVAKRNGTKTAADSVLAKGLGVSVQGLNNLRDENLTPRQVAGLVEKAWQAGRKATEDEAVRPVVEFFKIARTDSKRGARSELFSINDEDGEEHGYLSSLRDELDKTYGIYVFHDSRGRAIYAGKAKEQTLWKEMNSAFNRYRGNVQSIRRVAHPSRNVAYRTTDEKARQVRKEVVNLDQIATYFSAYEVAYGLIGKFESLVVRAFANDLLNVRMETFNPSR